MEPMTCEVMDSCADRMNTSMASAPRKESTVTKKSHKRWLKLTALVIGSAGPSWAHGSGSLTPARFRRATRPAL
jgi:hypothetical protein